VLGATLAGAAIGAVIGVLFFTERGRAFRRQVEPTLDTLARELDSFRLTVQKAAGVASEGWRLLNEAIENGSQTRSGRYPTPHQTSPF
jgi:hypothetical protein